MPKFRKAILLLAGQGTRMRPLTDEMPKCLIAINGRSILANALKNLEKNNIKETVLVVGYLKDKIKEAIGESFGDMKISYIENNLYNKTNNSYSLWLAIKEGLNEDSLILEGDIFFENSLLKEFVQDKRENLTIVEKYNPRLEGTFVEIRDNQLVLSWIHKKDRPKGFTLEDKYKTVNIHKFSGQFIQNWLIPVLKKHIDETGGREPIEFIFSEIIKNKGKIHAFVNKKKTWFEIDDESDLKIAREYFD